MKWKRKRDQNMAEQKESTYCLFTMYCYWVGEAKLGALPGGNKTFIRTFIVSLYLYLFVRSFIVEMVCMYVCMYVCMV